MNSSSKRAAALNTRKKESVIKLKCNNNTYINAGQAGSPNLEQIQKMTLKPYQLYQC
jgi:hypothetical protein